MGLEPHDQRVRDLGARLESLGRLRREAANAEERRAYADQMRKLGMLIRKLKAERKRRLKAGRAGGRKEHFERQDRRA